MILNGTEVLCRIGGCESFVPRGVTKGLQVWCNKANWEYWMVIGAEMCFAADQKNDKSKVITTIVSSYIISIRLRNLVYIRFAQLLETFYPTIPHLQEQRTSVFPLHQDLPGHLIKLFQNIMRKCER